MFEILKTYLKRLTNLSGNNKSLLQTRLYAKQDMDLHDLDFLLNKPSWSVIEDLIARKSSITLCDAMDSRNEHVNKAANKLKGIQRQDLFIQAERGSKDLYVGWPMAEGKFVDGTLIRTPLLFFPVCLELTNTSWQMKLRKEVPISFNKSFLLAYAHFNKIKVSDELLEHDIGEFPRDAQLFKSALYELLKNSELEINFNQDLFQNKLVHFHTYKRNELDQKWGNGEIKLFSEAVLGLYPQSGSYLVPDYEFLLENSKEESLEAFFLSKQQIPVLFGNEQNININRLVKSVREEHTVTPYKCDASQEEAIRMVKSGQSISVQGPPGTGKSQLICNLIADFTARGKKVLVVCQKRAALDVVYERLSELKLDKFSALVHDFKNDRKQIYEQIYEQIEAIDAYERMNNGLDTIYMERTHLQASRKIEQCIEELAEFKHALFDDTECGFSPKELYLTTDTTESHLNLNQECAYFSRQLIEEFDHKLSQYLPYYERLEKNEHPWQNRISFKDFTFSDLQGIKDTLSEIPDYQELFKVKLRELINHDFTITESEWLVDREQQIQDLLQLIKPPVIYRFLKELFQKSIDEDLLLIYEKRIMDSFEELGPELSVSREDLGAFQNVLEKYLRARKRFYKRWWWHLFNKDKYVIKRALSSNNLEWSRIGFRLLKKKIDKRFNLEHNLTELRGIDWLPDVPESCERPVLEEWFHNLSVAIRAKSILEELRSFGDFIKLDSSDYWSLKQRLEDVLALCAEAAQKQLHWSRYLSDQQIHDLLKNYDLNNELLPSLEKDFDALCEYDRLKALFNNKEHALLNKLLSSAKDASYEIVSRLFQNSIRLAWLNYFESKYPVLRSVSSLKMSQLERELQVQIKDKMKVSKDILSMKVREQTYKNIDYNRLKNRITYRDLLHQVSKKRKIWPMRKLIETHHEELFSLIPCWLASPESVSALFPMKDFFDLVIFDEASQCFAEKGIPAIYRAKQVVITGDSKQLSPNDLYQVRWEDNEDNDIPELEIDSLLDLGTRMLPEVSLEGHYRSESLDLIDFSNTHFYKGKLRLLPSFKDINEREPGISYLKVNGYWDKGVNLAEAQQIIEEVLQLLSQKQHSIGIVTFNYKQQHLIQDLLEAAALENNTLIPATLFVKNIENVQGDERDVILFSIGYAPNLQGKMHMHFGALNMENGENRLNVAVTRARKKVKVITSILPQQLQVEETKHIGPRLLKKYLEYAHTVSQGNYQPNQKDALDFHTDWFLKSKLKVLSSQKLGADVEHNNLPFADLTLSQNNNYRALLLTDDDIYYQSSSVKDFHAYLPLGLKEKKWPHLKIFSRQWWNDHEHVLKELGKLSG